jgi:hypothetical protein
MPDDKKSKKDDKAKGKVELGPDGKPLPPVELTETQQVQLQIDEKVSEVNILFPFYFISEESLYVLLYSYIFLTFY